MSFSDPVSLPRASRRHPPVRQVLGVGAAALVTALLVVGGVLSDTHDALVLMGFDPDRAQLITALMAGAFAAAGGVAVADRRLVATLAGTVVALGLFARTFRTETLAALQSPAGSGAFDPLGWALSLVTIVVVAVAAAWATAVVVGTIRRSVVEAGLVVVAAVRGRSGTRGQLWRPALVAGLAIVLGVALPVFGDMVNYSPDAHMRSGTAAGGGLVGGTGSASDLGALPSSDGSTVATGAIASPGASGALPSGLLPATAGGGGTSTGKPWLAWRPTGSGTIVKTTLPAPWVADGHPNAGVAIYLPPGYATSNRRYPVVYEVPWNFDNWQRAIGISGVLDGLITSGQVPPLIMVFAAHYGAPMPDTQCVDSADGRQQLERFYAKTVVQYVDSTYRTIATPTARALFGFSEGGYCSTMLLFRHPDVFSGAIAMSGYFQAAIKTAVTVNAPLPFGGDQAMIADHSPLTLAATLSPSIRSQLFVVLSADPTEWLYGPQYASMSSALQKGGYHYLLLPTALGHAWQAARLTLPISLQALAARWAATNVFAGQ